MPQHSFGASSRAGGTISSFGWRAIRTPLSLGAREGGLVVVVRRRLAGDRVLELAHPPADGAARLGQALRAQDDERDDEDEGDLQRPDLRSEHSWLLGDASPERGRPT